MHRIRIIQNEPGNGKNTARQSVINKDCLYTNVHRCLVLQDFEMSLINTSYLNTFKQGCKEEVVV